MIVKLFSDQLAIKSDYCGDLREILHIAQYPPLGIAMLFDVGETKGHYHTKLDEIYFVLDGTLQVEFFDPSQDASPSGNGKGWIQTLHANELCVITSGIHHQIISHSKHNRMCVICVPQFDPNDEFESDVL